MSISKADILSELNSRLRRNETDIDSIIEKVLEDLTIWCPAIKSLTSISVTEDTAEYNLETLISNFRNIYFLKLDDNAPLGKDDRITYEEYHHRIANESETTRAEPTEWALQDKTLYLYPTPNTDYTAYIFCSLFEQEADTISLDNEWNNPLVLGCCAEYLQRKGLGVTYSGINYRNEFIESAQKRINLYYKRNTKGITKYHDLG